MLRNIALVMLFGLGSLGLKAQQINITSPKSGDTLKRNNTYNITWTAGTGAPDTMQIYMFYDSTGFTVGIKICPNVLVSAGSASFTIPSSADYSSLYYLEAVPESIIDSPISQRVHFTIYGTSSHTSGVAPVPALQPQISNLLYAQGQLHIGYTLQQADKVSIRLYDQAGRLLVKENEGSYPAGDNQAAIRVNPLAPGMYICQLQAGDAVAVRKWMVLKY